MKEEKKKEEMNIKEFLNFRELAKTKRVSFDCQHVGGGNYLVECEQWFLSLLGY